MEFYAHSTENESKADWQLLREHLRNVADLAGESGEKLGLASLARMAGLLHDLGKYTAPFQRKLEGENITISHSTAGAVKLTEAAKTAGEPLSKLCAKIIAYCILGHHAGLPDAIGGAGSVETRLRDFAKSEEGKELERAAAWQKEIEFSAADLRLPPEFLPKLEDYTYKGVALSFLIRMVFSCLVDADRRDTQEFCDKKLRGKGRKLVSILPQLLEYYDKFMAEKRASSPDNELNRLRNDILAEVLSQAGGDKGFYSLTVPTGGGKTLASLGFALRHAQHHKCERIIYALPFTSIIDQTANIFRELFGQEHKEDILEHHSNFELSRGDEAKGEKEQSAQQRLKEAMEDWDMPLIITTNVQLFESLYSAKASAARKLKNIANSIIILDEAQTIPLNLLAPCARALDILVQFFGCTVIFCTATQPALDEAHMQGDRAIAGLPLGADRELAPNPQQLAEKLRRATIKFAGDKQGKIGELSNEQLIEALAEQSRELVIVNNRRHAYDLYQAGKEQGIAGLIHLTTRQCAADRREIIADIRARLKEGQPCRVIATSLVEAGVDFDFPRVWRAEAGLDSVLQAAGRCNREGKRPREESITMVFRAESGYGIPPELRANADSLKYVWAESEDLFSPEAIEAYFRETYWKKGEKLDKEKIIREDLADETLHLDYPLRHIGEKFRMIESGMLPVIIPRNDAAKDWIAKMGAAEISSGRIARALQAYIVQVPLKARERLIENGHAAFQAEHIRGDQFVALVNPSLYTPETGLLWENADYLAAEQCNF